MDPTRRSVLTLLAAAPLATAPALAAETAGAFLAEIYSHYTGEGGMGVPLDNPATVERYFEPTLAKLINDDAAQAAEVDDLPELNGDPFVDAQDWDLANLKATTDASGPDSASGHVTFDNMGEAKAIDIDMVRTAKGWRIADIHWSEGSLRGLYTH
ncbi:DUF3828 domain-containing protein [Kaistia dalseonensis]|uniref:DUF3828 domain-containing protein n=1 Tax=Kaistia dalseonensis TaxID=410840 RepID=A0ABU0H8Q6_9HYPH|nr:DUF3828 domain-containing protein [Kaistia dalseonensis]MCX5496090.1 DUF3828 domain-containing protein [Kaistia dalseonensis]MDQ0438695.1 hypothetical protein [Kaistia dalseonensis]